MMQSFILALVGLLVASCGGDHDLDRSAQKSMAQIGAAASRRDSIACGGLRGVQCPSGLRCVDDPSDDCDPTNGGADCLGVCVTSSTDGVVCGGFGGAHCPTGLTCVDDPSDDCDPMNGGADCLGICR
jgi:hypothetical protein